MKAKAILIGLAAAIGLVAVAGSSSAGTGGASGAFQPGETWRAEYSISPAMVTSQTYLDAMEAKFRASLSSNQVTFDDIQFTPTGTTVVLTFHQASPKPALGMSFTMSGHTMTLTGLTRVK